MDINSLVELKANPKIPNFRPGDTVRVYAKVIEGDRERIQAFEGVVIKVRKGGPSSNFTVRRVSHGVGVERVFPYFSPLVDKVDVVRVGSVRRARLYYLRQRVGKAARIKAGSRDRFEMLTQRPFAPEDEAEDMEEEGVAEEETTSEGEEGAGAAVAVEETGGAEATEETV